MTAKQPQSAIREGYRRRRAQDAARLLPILGAFLVLLPVLWGGGGTRSGIIYIFVVWLGLIIVAAVLARVLQEPDNDVTAAQPEGPDNGSV